MPEIVQNINNNASNGNAYANPTNNHSSNEYWKKNLSVIKTILDWIHKCLQTIKYEYLIYWRPCQGSITHIYSIVFYTIFSIPVCLSFQTHMYGLPWKPQQGLYFVFRTPELPHNEFSNKKGTTIKGVSLISETLETMFVVILYGYWSLIHKLLYN